MNQVPSYRYPARKFLAVVGFFSASVTWFSSEERQAHCETWYYGDLRCDAPPLERM